MKSQQTIIESPYLNRKIDITQGPHSCEVFTKSPDDSFFKSSHHNENWGIPFEAAVKLDNKWEQIGIHNQKNVLWKDKKSSFKVIDVITTQGVHGTENKLICRSAAHNSKDIEVSICYEVSSTLPFLRKQVSVKNISSNQITIQNICVELFYSVRIERNIQILHDFRKDVSGYDRHYVGYHDFQFPEDIDIELLPGESIDSFNLYEVFTPDDECGQAVWMGRVLKSLAPWAAKQSITFQCSGIEPDSEKTGIKAFERILKQCSESGVEIIMFFLGQIWTNTGDYIIRPDLFPNGEDDLKALIKYIHGLGMKAGVYCSYSIADHGSKIREKNLDWECINEQNTRFDPAAWGNMCFLSPWGEYVQDKFLWLVKDLQFDELQIDGPTDIPCFNNSHSHSSFGNYNYKNWQWEKSLFESLRIHDVTFSIPRGINYILMGANRIPGGYTEQDFCHDSGIKLLTNYRSSMYNQRKHSPAWATWGFLALGVYHGNAIGASEETPEIFEQGIAALLGYGNGSFISGKELYYGSETQKILKKWISLFKQYRQTFCGDFIRLASPNGKHLDAALFTNPHASCQALGIFFNPTEEELKSSFTLPLKYTGFSVGQKVTIVDSQTNKDLNLQIDSCLNISFEVKLSSHEVKVFLIVSD